jgi:drug/metabolite transporter (DMT)-like permease
MSENRYKQWLSLVVLALIWGSSFILIKRALFTSDDETLFSGVQVGAMRIVIAAIFMLPVALKKINLLKNHKALFFVIVGLCGNAIPAFLFAIAQTKISSALAGMLNATVPLFSLVIAHFIFRVRVRSGQVVGLFTGLIAAVGLLWFSGNYRGQGFQPEFAALALLATLCYAISLNTIKQYLQEAPAIAITAIALLMALPVGLVVFFTSGTPEVFSTNAGAWRGLLAVSTLAILGTALALILFNKLVQQTNTIFASSVTYLIPLVALMWGFIDGEEISLGQICCAGLMIGGIVMINRN